MSKAEEFDKKQEYYDQFEFNKKGNPFVLKKIKPESRVLDVGCGSGNLGIGLKEKDCIVYGVDISDESIKKSREKMHRVEKVDLEAAKNLPFNEKFDYIVFADILEHLRNPEHILNLVRDCLKEDGKIIISIPNIAFIAVRLKLLFGKFEYTEYGICDSSHVRFYTLKSFQRFLKDKGLKILSVEGFPLTIRRFTFITYPITQVFKALLARQFIIEAKL